MKIALITTGGTIGSAVTDGVTNVSEAADIELKKALLSATEGRDDIVIRPAADILSENMTPDVFRLIAGAIRTALNENKYEGIIVTHGTDTLTFSANALALMFSDTPIPIVLLSANAPLASGGNGRENLAAALTLIRERLCGVFVVYANEKDSVSVHLGARLVESDEMTGYVRSIGNVAFGRVLEGRFVYNDAPTNPLPLFLKSPGRASGFTDISTDIVTIHSRSMLDFDMYLSPSKPPRACVVKTYHSGTVPGAAGKYGIGSFIERAEMAGAKVVLAPVNSALAPYASSIRAYKKALVARDISFGTAVAKVMLALGSGMDVGEVLEREYAFERFGTR